MAIEYPEIRCEDSPTHAHHFTPVTSSIWRCKYCWHPLWLPTSWKECVALTDSIGRLGLSRAYQEHLQDKPVVRQILRKLEEIRLLRKVLPEKQLLIAIAAIALEKGEKEEGGRVLQK